MTGYDAIEHARETGAALHKYTDPIEEARRNITVEEAEEIASEDPGLIYTDEENK